MGSGDGWGIRGAFGLALGALVAVLAGCAAGPGGNVPGAPVPEAGGRDLVIVLVRHAEAYREPGGDPDLTGDGVLRAERLASVLRDAGIEVIHSSGYRRTDQTAAPLAAGLGVEPVPYDAEDLPALADRLKGLTGRHLVVGHSNTTPEVVRLLGGEPGSAIDASEHDRLYLVTIEPGGVRTVLLRY